MRGLLSIIATTSIGIALVSCASPQSRVAEGRSQTPLVYESRGGVVRTPLPAPGGYAPPPATGYAPVPSTRYGGAAYAGSETDSQAAARLGWHASPRWAVIKPRSRASAVKQDGDAKFRAAQEKANRVGVENLTQDDIEGLAADEIKELRGY
jgi:hypothetical protein